MRILVHVEDASLERCWRSFEGCCDIAHSAVPGVEAKQRSCGSIVIALLMRMIKLPEERTNTGNEHVAIATITACSHLFSESVHS